MKPGNTDIACPIGEFITVGARERLFTGILFSEGATPLYLHFRQGQLINIESWDPVHSIPAFAIAAGLVSPEEYGRVRAAQIETGDKLLDLLKRESRIDHATILRLYESFAYATLLHLIRENADFSAAEGAVAADPILIEAISPERFTARLTALVDGNKTRRILELLAQDIEVNDPACGLESGPVAAAFLHTAKRFPEQFDLIEETLASGAATLHARRSGIVALLVPIVLLCIVWGLMILLYAAPQKQMREDARAADLQIETLRGRLIDAVRSLDDQMRKP